MKRIITIIAMTACAAVLMSSCQKSMPEKKAGVPLTIQASIVEPTGTKTIYEYDTESKTLEGYWNSEEAITVVSFGNNGITAVDKFTSVGEKGRTKAEFSGTWHGNEGDRVICLYPAVDSYVGRSIFDDVSVGDSYIYMRGFSTPSAPLKHEDTGSVSDVDLMLGEVTVSGDVAHVYLKHLFAVFRIEVTLKNFSYEASAASPYDMAKINTIRIKCVDPDTEMDDWDDPVFVVSSHLNVTTDDYNGYTGMPVTDEKRPLDYYLLTSGTSGYYPNPSKVCVFSDWHGNYTDLGDPCENDTFGTSFFSQFTCVLKLPGTDKYIAMADRWKPTKQQQKMGLQYLKLVEKAMSGDRHADLIKPDKSVRPMGSLSGRLLRHAENTSIARYVWLPIEWEDDKPVIRWYNEWKWEDMK